MSTCSKITMRVFFAYEMEVSVLPAGPWLSMCGESNLELSLTHRE